MWLKTFNFLHGNFMFKTSVTLLRLFVLVNVEINMQSFVSLKKNGQFSMVLPYLFHIDAFIKIRNNRRIY